MKPTDTTSELDLIQSFIWARIHDELVKEGVKLTIGQAYACGSVIKEVLHPRVRLLIDKVQTEARIQEVIDFDGLESMNDVFEYKAARIKELRSKGDAI